MPSPDAILHAGVTVLALWLTRWLDERAHGKINAKLDKIMSNGHEFTRLTGKEHP